MTTTPRSVAQQAQELGFTPIPLGKDGDPKAPLFKNWQHRTFSLSSFTRATNVGLRTGLQRDGLYLNVVDFDHKPDHGIDAPAHYQATLDRLPSRLRAKLFKALSTSRTGRYLIFRTRHEIASGTLCNTRGHKIGDFLGPGKQVVAPTPDRWLDESTLAAIPIIEAIEADEVLAAAGYRQTRRVDAPHESNFDWKEAEHCYTMLDGILKRIGQHTVTYRQLHGDGGPDRSDTRYGLACELRKRYGYPDEEIAAILYHFHFGGLQDRGTTGLKADIERCIADANALYPDAQTKVSYCRTSWQAPERKPLPFVEKNKGGRPTRLTEDKYLSYLKRHADSNAVMRTQGELAHALKVSVATIRRLEKRLAQQGQLERRTVRKKGGTYSYVVFSAIKTSQQDAVLVRSVNAETAQPDAPNNENASLGVTLLSDSPSPDLELQPTPRLVPLVRAMRAAGARTWKQVRRMLREYVPDHGWSDEAIRAEVQSQARQERIQRTIERETAKIRAATPDELRRWARSYAWHHLDARKRGHERQAYMWASKEALVNEEIERRQKAGDWPPERRKRARSKQETVSTFLETEQASLSLSNSEHFPQNFGESEPSQPELVAPSDRSVPPQQPLEVVQPVSEQPPPEPIRLVCPWLYTQNTRRQVAKAVRYD